MKRYLFYALFAFFTTCTPEQQQTNQKEIPAKEFRAETLQMMDSIKAIYARTDFRNHLYESGEKLKLVEQEVLAADAKKDLTPRLYIEYGKTLLDAGKSKEAAEVFERVLRQLPGNRQITQTSKSLHEALAISYMRLGEQINCQQNHSAESCIMPIKGEGIHQWQDGSQKAIEIYLQILTAFPDDLRSRWLLNIAYMTLGQYPDKVPAKYLIPPIAFRSEYELPYFENIATHTGLDINDLAGSVIADDFNNDGWLDLMLSSWSMQGRLYYYVSDGNGGYADQTEAAGLQGVTGGLNLIQADYNNDGFLDFYIMRGAWRGSKSMGILPNSLIKNNGDGTFTDVTISSGIYAAFPTQSAVWLDINTDGWLDLFVGNETHNRQDIHPCQLWLNQKDGSFTDVAPKLGLNFQIYVKGVATGDINNDGLPDLYISSINGPNKLLANRGGTNPDDWVFEDITEKAGVAEPLESFPAWFFDYNNDGWDDLFVSSFDKFSLNQQSREVAADYLGITSNSDWPRLYRNEGGEQFSDQTQSTSLRRILPTMGCNFGDLDNDGFLDFYLGTGAPDYRAIVPNRMFRNNAGQSFQDVTSAGNFGHIQKGHGIAFADLDNDGDQDIYAVMGGSLSGDIFPNALFENPGNENKWLILRLEGTHSNRSAIGAKIRIDLQEENGSKRQVFVTVNSGGSFGANSLQQEIGLGEAVKISNIAINWPDGKPTYTDYGEAVSNKAYRIKEGENQLEIIECKPFKFIKDLHSTGHHH